jgi:hypothetical protein
VIQEAESLRAILRQAVSQSKQLVAALKQHRRKSKSVRSALASLRQLETIEA